MADRVQAMIPDLEAYATHGMKAFGAPALAVGIVVGDKLVYAKGFGVGAAGQPVDARTIFQIGSNTKAFLATTEAIMVDRGKLNWDDRVVDLYPAFQLKDPWVTREFRVFDLLAQRSSLPPLANDVLTMSGFDEAALIGSLRNVEPVSSFRTTFAYTNITHLLASRIVANAAGAADWNAVLQKELLDPLAMTETSYGPEAIEGAANHVNGHYWTPTGAVETPFTPIFPYRMAGAGDMNSNIEDMSHWVALQLGRGAFEGRRLVSKKNLAVTWTPKVAVSDSLSYAMGWWAYRAANGSFLWHDGDALSFGSFVAVSPDRNVGVIVLTNETNVGFPNTLGAWMMDRILGNPPVDYVTAKLAGEKAQYEAMEKRFARPANPSPPPALASLAGAFVNPSFGRASVTPDGDGLSLTIAATGAKFRLTPFDGGIFVAQLTPEGAFAPIVALHYMTRGFAQFQIDDTGQLNRLRFSTEDGQAFEFRRE